MYEKFIKIRLYVLSLGYCFFLKPLFFSADPEDVHNFIIKVGNFLGNYFLTQRLIKFLFYYNNLALRQKILGITFENPVGLAAGFDKDAELTQILPFVGFGFEEVGSITYRECRGNPKPRLWREKKLKSLIVLYGLKNKGAQFISTKLKKLRFKFPVGTSIAKTNDINTSNENAGIKDYLEGFKFFANIGDYFTINVSCPNAFGGQPFHHPETLDKLLAKIDKIPTAKPVFIKLSPDLSYFQIDKIIAVLKRHRVDGLIISNLTKKRPDQIMTKEALPKGGISGKPVEKLSNELIAYIYKKTKKRFVIIGCGGVFSGKDAYMKIKLGASLIQLITGMIYEGPQLISQINQELVRLLKKDGFSNVSQAVGSEFEKE